MPGACPRAGAGRLLALAAALALLLSLGADARGADPTALRETAEWGRLVTLWHTLLDHSSNRILSRARFAELAKDMERAEDDISALVAREALSAETGATLRWVLHRRYQYLSDQHYSLRSRVFMEEGEAAAVAAGWLIEHHLEAMRVMGSEGRGRSELAYQLGFLHHLGKFEEEVERRRQKLEREESEGGRVDWQAFDNECHRRRNLLLRAYRTQRLPRVRSVEDVLPHLIALTTTQPPGPPEPEGGAGAADG